MDEVTTITAITSFTGKYNFLCNFYHSPIEYEGETYRTVEHGFQALKSIRMEHRDAIRRASNPAVAKEMGQRVPLRKDWEEVKDSIMLLFLRLKFQKEEFKQLLLSTGDMYLEEGNNHGDTIWGTVNGFGENRLGQLLMQVRTELRNEQH